MFLSDEQNVSIQQGNAPEIGTSSDRGALIFNSTVDVRGRFWRERANSFAARERVVPEEVAVALTYDGATYSVMMATPQDLRDFAVGYSITEGIISCPADIETFEECLTDGGIELRTWLARSPSELMQKRRRRTAGPTGCGLCGIESLSEAMRYLPPVDSHVVFDPHDIMAAMRALKPLQELNSVTHGTHAAAFWSDYGEIVNVREDVGRHNALDKLIGSLIIQGIDPKRGMVLLTSRLSVELVQKVGAVGIPAVVSVSVPTGLALRIAEAAGITVAAIARDDGFEVFSGHHRLSKCSKTNLDARSAENGK
jgi:FdhD protein